jgi:hypothetical protein
MRRLKKEIWPHCVRINTEHSKDSVAVDTWLGERLGPFKGRWNFVDHYGTVDYYFKRGSDATMFMLRWS